MIGVKEIWQVDDITLGITWTDNREDHFNVLDLRKQCPCAECRDEKTGIQRHISVSDDLRPVEIHSTGQYALTIKFNDGHKTGIYPFDRLRNMA